MSIFPYALEKFCFFPSQNINLEEKKKELKEIFNSHTDYQDTTSVRLKKWMVFVLKNKKLDLGALLDQIILIRTDVLLNPFTCSTIEEPVLLNDRIWDLKTLLECQRYLKLCPYSQRPLELEHSFHELAKSILKWSKSFFHDVALNEKSLNVFPHIENQEKETVIPKEEWDLVPDEEKNTLVELYWKGIALKKIEDEGQKILDQIIAMS